MRLPVVLRAEDSIAGIAMYKLQHNTRENISRLVED